MAMQITESLLVQYGLSTTTDWTRSSLSRIQNYADEDSLPKDPRQWSKEHVIQWLNFMTTEHGLPEVPASRFAMNGKGLCLMSLHMFLARVPFGGKLLYKDFQLRLCAALHSIN